MLLCASRMNIGFTDNGWVNMNLIEQFKKLQNKFEGKTDIGQPPYDYFLLLNLPEKEYPIYLKRMYAAQLHTKLNLENPRSFNEKIQWLKLYDATPLKTRLTDKVLVRDWVAEKIGADYLKPMLWHGTNFDEIPWEELPEKFLIKANHGCKWQYRIKNKSIFVENKNLMGYIKDKMQYYLVSNFFPMAGFEMQYKDIKPQLLIEPLMLDGNIPVEYSVFCFNGVPKIYQKIKFTIPFLTSIYNEDYSLSDIRFNDGWYYEQAPADDFMKEAVMLSEKLCKEFKLVRVDWLYYNNKIYFNEMTFTPYSGFYQFEDDKMNMELGKMLKL